MHKPIMKKVHPCLKKKDIAGQTK